MLVAHLVHGGAIAFSPDWWLWLAEYTRFAAAGFILVSGMTIGLVFGRRDGAYLRMDRRAGEVLVAHFAMTLLAYALLAPQYPVGPLVWQVVTLREGHDLLPFYVVMLLAAPGMLWLLRRGLGWLLLLISAGLYGLDIAVPGTFLLPLQDKPEQSTFLVLRWQGFFVLGVWAGYYLKRFDAWPNRRKLAVVIAASLVTVTCHLLAYDEQYGLNINPGLVFWKQVLSVPEFVKYLALCVTIFGWTGLAWRWLASPMRPMATLGRHALPVYVAHVYLLAPLAALSVAVPLPDAGKLAWLVIGVAALWAFAVGVEWLQRKWKPTRYVAAPAIVVASVAYMFVWQLL